MGTVARRTISRKVESQKESFFEKLIRTFRTKREYQTRQDLEFLLRDIYQYYFEALFRAQDSSGTNIPDFLYEQECKERAEHCALNELLFRVADRKVVSKLANRRRNQLEGQRKRISL